MCWMVGRLRWLILSATLLLLAPWPVLGAEPAVPKEAQDLLREAQRSRGGIIEMARVAEIRRQGELVLATSDGERIVPLRVVVRPPGHLVLETGAGDDLVRREFMDGKAWEVRSDGPPRELSPEEAARFRDLVMVDEAFLVRAALAGDLLITGVEDAGPGQVSLDLPAADGRAVLLQNTAGAAYRLDNPWLDWHCLLCLPFFPAAIVFYAHMAAKAMISRYFSPSEHRQTNISYM